MLEVNNQGADVRLDRWLKKQIPGLNQGVIEKALRKGLVKVNGKKAKSSDRLAEGDQVYVPEHFYHVSKQSKSKVNVTHVPLPEEMILYQDDQLLVLNKPSGLAVQGGKGIKESLDDMLRSYAKGGQVPKLVHRLDKDTSGLVLVAKDDITARKLAADFKERAMKKTYLALVAGKPYPPKGTIECCMAKVGSAKEMMSVVEPGTKGAQDSMTDYELLASKKGVSLVELKPKTGRKHQLRVHMKAFECPIVGDGKYGEVVDVKKSPQHKMKLSNKLHLHAYKIAFIDENGKKWVFEAPLPEHICQSMEKIGISLTKA